MKERSYRFLPEYERDVFLYSSREEAEKGGEQMTMAFGDQIVWYGVRKRIQQRVR